MKIDRSINAKRNIIWGMINKIIVLILPFIIRTLIINEMGSSYLGINSLFISILQVLNLSELGFSTAIIFSMYRPIAEDDTKTICALLGFYRRVYRYIGFIILGVGLILMPFIGLFINGPSPEGVNIYILYCLYLLNTVISYFLFAYKSCLLLAHQRNDIITNILSIVMILQYGFQITAIIVAKNFYLFVISMIVCTILNNLLIHYFSKIKYPLYKSKGTITSEVYSEIKYKIGGLMIGKVCIISRNSFDSIFISAFLGLTIVAQYGNYYYIMFAVIGILQVLISSINAGVGNSLVTETKITNYNNMMKFIFVYAWISSVFTVCLLCLYQPFMEIWVGKELKLPIMTVVLFCIYFYVLTMGDIRSLYNSAAGLWWESRFYVLSEAICNLVLNFVFVQIWGLNGVIIATMISIFTFNFIWGSQIIFKFYFVGISPYKFFVNHMSYFVVTIISGGISYFCCTFFSKINGLDIIMVIFISFTLPNAIMYIVYRKNKLFIESLEFMKSRLKIK